MTWWMLLVKRMGYDLTEILGDWLGSTDMAGFICQAAKIYRIPDSVDGSPRYQMLFTIRNDEPAPGFFRFGYYYVEEGGKQNDVKADPIRLAGKSTIQYGTIVSGRPTYATAGTISLSQPDVHLFTAEYAG